MLAIEHLPLIKGEIADYRFDGFILYSYSKPVVRTVDTIRSNIALVKSITGGRAVPLLIYMSKSPVPDKATRDYSTQMLPEVYTAMAMVSEPGLSQLVMRILFRFMRPPIPMRGFQNDESALHWLKSFV